MGNDYIQKGDKGIKDRHFTISRLRKLKCQIRGQQITDEPRCNGTQSIPGCLTC